MRRESINVNSQPDAAADSPAGSGVAAFVGGWKQCVDALDDGMCVLDMSGTIIAANRALRERLDGRPDRLIGRNYRVVFYGSDAPDTESPWGAVLSGALSAQVETSLPAMNGWFLVSCYALLDPHGQQWGAVSSHKDITARKQRDDLLHNLSHGPLAAGGVMFFRQLVLALRSALDVSCVYIGEFTAGECATIRTVAVCVEGEIAENVEFPLAGAPGEVVLMEHRAGVRVGVGGGPAGRSAFAALDLDSYLGLPLWDSTGRPLGVLAVMDRRPIANPRLVESMLRIVTARVASELERKHAEDTLRQSEERYRTVAENTHDLICKTTLEGDYSYISPNHRDVFHRDLDALLGTNLLERIHPEDRPAVANALERGHADRTPISVVHRYYLRDRECRWFESTGRLVRGSGGIPEWVIVSRDITDRKRMEDELLNARKLEAIGFLAGGIAHDFNNVLTTILGNVSMAKIPGLADGVLRNRLAEAERACVRAQELTKRILTFAKGGEPVMARVAIGDVIRGAVTRAMEKTDMTCEVVIPNDLGVVFADVGQVDQVVENVVNNACQSMPEGGQVTVRAERSQVSSDAGLLLEDGAYVRVVFRDRGSGISDADLSKVFDPFFTTRHEGSGLGLAIAYSIMKHHGGAIGIASECGVGTEVTLYFPTVEAPPWGPSDSEQPLLEGRGVILVIEDDEPICSLLSQTMAYLGYEAVFASNGSEGLTRYMRARDSGNPFQAVLMDLVIPGGMGGKEMIAQLRVLDPDVKAIVSSGYSRDPVMAEFQKYGFQAAIAKPYRISELSTVLHEVLHRSPAH